MKKVHFSLLPIDSRDITNETAASSTRVMLKPESLGMARQAVPPVESLYAQKDVLRDHLDVHGALVLRGFDIGDNGRFEKFLSGLGFNLMESNFGGASPRPRLANKVFVSTEAPKPFIIGFHTEFCYQQRRPGLIAFLCRKEAARDGETPIFDCARVYEELSVPLRQKLEALGVRYTRRIYGQKSLINFRQTWSTVFDTSDPAVVEEYLRAEGMSFNWEKDGTLVTELNLPAVLRDPHSGEKLLSITMFNGASFAYNFWHFQERYSPLFRFALENIVHWETREGRRFLYASWGDGTPFSRAESEEIQRAAWKHAIIFRWRRNDVLLLNNKRWGHARLNVRGDRQVVVAMADPYDIRQCEYRINRPEMALVS